MFRADRIYRTGVLSPLPGYEPGANVQAVAQRFTSAGPYVQGQPTAGMALRPMPLAGPVGAIKLGPIQRLKIRWQLARSEKRARKMLARLAAMGVGPAAGAPMAGLHGLEPGRESMAQLAARVSNGRLDLPTVMRSQLQAGTAIIPRSSGVPMQLSAEAVARAPQYVRDRAASYGYGNWAGKRSWWFDKPVPFKT